MEIIIDLNSYIKINKLKLTNKFYITLLTMFGGDYTGNGMGGGNDFAAMPRLI
jgi:hypothetical protein